MHRPTSIAKPLRRPRALLAALLSPLLVALSLAGPAPALHAADETEDADAPSGFAVVAEDGISRLYLDRETTEIAVESIASGEFWYSNPQGRDEDPLAKGVNLSRLGSQLTAIYNNEAAQQQIKDNHTDAIRQQQFEIHEEEGGVAITYTIGKAERQYLHPLALSVERFEAVYEQAERSTQRILRRRYTLYEPDELRPAQRDELIARYPALADGPLYALRDGISAFILEEIDSAFEAAGYTQEDKVADEASAGIVREDAAQDNVVVTMHYGLDQGDLIVRIPTSEIEYDASRPLTQLRVLEYFGAGSAEEEGYLFVPDGSGALIHYNNQKLETTQYLDRVYGADTSLRQTLQVGVTEQISLPVFGARTGKQAFLGIIEEGSAIAAIRADIAGRVDSYNQVHPVFQILAQDQVDMKEIAGSNIIMAYQDRPYSGELRLRYRLLSGEDADYSGMARSYRDYLAARGELPARDPVELEAPLPLQLELLAAVDRIRPFLGIPLSRIEPLTRFEEAGAIVAELHAEGVERIDLRLSGWANGGLRQHYPDRLKRQGQLGSARDFNALSEQLAQAGDGFYPDVSFSYVHRNGLFDGFSLNRDAARHLDREIVELRAYSPATMQPRPFAEPYWAISPRRFASLATSLQRAAGDLGLPGLSLGDIGRELGADYRRGETMDRETAMQEARTALATLAEGQPLLLDYGNAYALPYATRLIDVPGRSSHFAIQDQSIPFVAMVLHGAIDFSLEALNLSDDIVENRLQMLENGALPRFALMAQDGAVLKDSEYSRFFSARYADWRETVVATYRELAPILGPLRGLRIVRHAQLAPGLSVSEYEDGSRIYVNRAEEAQMSPDGEVPARHYLIEEGQR